LTARARGSYFHTLFPAGWPYSAHSPLWRNLPPRRLRCGAFKTGKKGKEGWPPRLAAHTSDNKRVCEKCATAILMDLRCVDRARGGSYFHTLFPAGWPYYAHSPLWRNLPPRRLRCGAFKTGKKGKEGRPPQLAANTTSDNKRVCEKCATAILMDLRCVDRARAGFLFPHHIPGGLALFRP
jgi:hypothetical protein